MVCFWFFKYGSRICRFTCCTVSRYCFTLPIVTFTLYIFVNLRWRVTRTCCPLNVLSVCGSSWRWMISIVMSLKRMVHYGIDSARKSILCRIFDDVCSVMSSRRNTSSPTLLTLCTTFKSCIRRWKEKFPDGWLIIGGNDRSRKDDESLYCLGPTSKTNQYKSM